MESTEKCEVVIQHFNGKYLKTPPGIPGESPPPLLYITLASPCSFLSWKIITFEMRNFLSNSIMVISHLRSAGQLDRLCTPLFLTPEASSRGYGWIADGSVRPLPLRLSFCHHLSPSLVVLLLQAGASWAGENPLNIHTHASVLFFAIYLRACTLPSLLSVSMSSLLPISLSCSHPRQWNKLAKEKTGREKRLKKRKSQKGDRCRDSIVPHSGLAQKCVFYSLSNVASLSQKFKTKGDKALEMSETEQV